MSIKIKAILALVLAALMLIPALIYLALAIDGEKAEAQENTIKVYLNETDYMMQQFIQTKLEQTYPEIKVSLTMSRNWDSADYYNSVKDGSYDVFTSPEGYFDQIATSGKIAAIGDYLEAENFGDMACCGAIQDYEDGNIYTIPYEPANYTVIYYNRQIFDELGLTVPETAEQLLEVCEALKQNGIPALATSASESWQSCMLLEAFALTVEPDITKRIMRKEASFGDAPYVWAAELLQTLVENDYIESKFLNQSYAQNSTSFIKGEVAMLADGSWSLNDKATRSVNKSGWFFAPVKDYSYIDNYGISSGSSMKIGNGFLISNDCTDKRSAVKIAICIAAAYAEYLYQYGDTTATVYKADELGWEIKSVTPYFGVADYMRETQRIEYMYPYLQDVSAAGSDICGLLSQLLKGQIDAVEFSQRAAELDDRGRKSY